MAQAARKKEDETVRVGTWHRLQGWEEMVAEVSGFACVAVAWWGLGVHPSAVLGVLLALGVVLPRMGISEWIMDLVMSHCLWFSILSGAVGVVFPAHSTLAMHVQHIVLFVAPMKFFFANQLTYMRKSVFRASWQTLNFILLSTTPAVIYNMYHDTNLYFTHALPSGHDLPPWAERWYRLLLPVLIFPLCFANCSVFAKIYKVLTQRNIRKQEALREEAEMMQQKAAQGHAGKKKLKRK
eukprot:TRINITY_DN10657_c0_g1_i1.p1 TRINITY_DN10657_c0_g1~~TRINITY_DN10657_c0_g1_i1.p1  ORF type:complete len:239 (+),score=41.11 TRINITY_DN10657_c0_g1_i1:184-900(+)